MLEIFSIELIAPGGFEPQFSELTTDLSLLPHS
jgi:hypothetical protein